MAGCFSAEAHSFDPPAIPDKDGNPVCEGHGEYAGKGKVVKILDMAFVTWVQSVGLPNALLMLLQAQAFLMHLYTNAIEFAPFGSEENRRSRNAEIVTPSNGNVLRPSPKTTYG